jgi:hypothetical protein
MHTTRALDRCGVNASTQMLAAAVLESGMLECSTVLQYLIICTVVPLRAVDESQTCGSAVRFRNNCSPGNEIV